MTVPGRCHFDADGWLRGPVAITHYTSPNHYASGFADKAKGMVQHTEDGFTAGTVETFMNPATRVSAFFGVSENGDAQQFLPVGHGYVAWAEAAGNPYWRSCECEDMTRTGDPMTQAQVATFAQILEACSAYDGFPLQITDDVNGTGLITHGDGGVPWGNHPYCPGDVRRAQRPAIIALAKQIRAGSAPVPVTPPKPAVRAELHVTAGLGNLAELAAAHSTTPAAILQATAGEGPYPADITQWLDNIFAGAASATTPMEPGLRLYIPA